MAMTRMCAFRLGLALWVAATVSQAQSVKYVNAGATGVGPFDGSSWANAYTNLAVALTGTGSGTNLWVAKGTYRDAAPFQLKSGVQLYGGFTNGMGTLAERDWVTHSTLLDGQAARTVLLGASGATLDGFIVTNGAAINGGGLLNNSVAPTLRNCVFANNAAGTMGGAIYNNGDASDTALSNCVFRGNSATYGGAVGNNDADPLLQACQFLGNTATTYGGAIYNSQVAAQPAVFDSQFTSNRALAGGALFGGSFVPLSNCVFRANTATDTGGGGAAYLSSGTHTLRNCDFIQNTAINGGALTTLDAVGGIWDGLRFLGNVATTGVGGAIYGTGNPVPSYAMRNSVFAGNQSSTYGGAVYGRTSGTFENCVWSGNRTAGKGGGYSSVEDNSIAGSPRLKRCRFAGNEALGNGGAIWHTGGIVDLENSVLAGNVAGGDGGGVCKRADYGGGGSQIRHSALVGNRAGARGGAFSANYESTSTVSNSILWGNSAATSGPEIYNPAPGTTLLVAHSDVAGGWSGLNNLNVDPQFTADATGTWAVVSAYDALAGQTALTASGPWAVNAHAGKTVNPDRTQWLQFVVASNTVNTLYVWGNACTNRAGTAVADAGDAYRIVDVHIADASPLVDAGAALGVTNDLADAVRPREGAPDVGAYEVQTDVLPPPAITNLVAYPLHQRVEFEWVNPPSHDRTGVLVVRNAGTPPTGTPVTGQSYTNGEPLGDGVVVHTADAASWTDAPLAAGTTYFYRFFAYDDAANYSAAVATNATPVDDVAAPADVAGLTAAGGTGTVSLAWTNPTDGDFGGVVIVRRQGADPTGAPVTGQRYTVGQTLGDGVVIVVGTATDGNPGAANGFLDGGLADATAYHYAVFSMDQVRNYAAGQLVAATTALDVVPPADVSGLGLSSGDTWVQLSWTNPVVADLAGVLVLRRVGAAPGGTPAPTVTYGVGDSIDDGVVVFNGAATSGATMTWRDESVTNTIAYYYRVFARDEVPNYSAGVGGSATPQVRNVLYVDWQAAGANNGTSWADAYTTVDAALTAASGGTNIWVATGTYKPNAGRDSSFVLKANVGVYGGFTNGITAFHQRNWVLNPTTLSGDIDNSDAPSIGDVYHVVTATWATNAVLDGVTVTSGYAYSALFDTDVYRNGGGLYLWNSDVTLAIRNCRFVNNVANYLGGAACIRHASRGATGVVISNCVFQGNSTFRANDGHGGAIYHVYRPLTVVDSALEDNAATLTGGAIESSSGDLVLRRCKFARNTALNAANSGRGGAIFHDRSDLTAPIIPAEIVDCRFYGNRASLYGALDYRRAYATNDLIRNSDFFANETTAGAAGALFLYRYDSVIEDCRFSGNTVAGGNVHGGGVYLYESDAMVRSIVLAGNTASGYGGGLWADNGSRARFENLLVAGNQARYSGGGMCLYDPSRSTNVLLNCTIAGNRTTEPNVGYGGGGLFLRNGIFTLTNSIVWGNRTGGTGTQVRVDLSGDVLTVGHSDIEFGVTNIYTVAGASKLESGGVMALDPKFTVSTTGVWTAAAIYTNANGLTVLTDATASWTPGKLAGFVLNPNTNAAVLAYLVVTNTPTTVSVMGVATTGVAGASYQLTQYGLRGVSPCLDSAGPQGAPTRDLAGLARPQGGGVDMGAFERVREPYAPEPVTGLTATGGMDQVALAWRNPTNADFAGVLIVRRAGAAPTTAPVWTNEYLPGSALGDGVVVYAGWGSNGAPGQESNWLDTGVPALQTFHYAVYAYDGVPNYAAGAAASATTLLDAVAPRPVSGLAAVGGGSTVMLSWTNSPDADFAEVLIVRRESAVPTGAPVDTNRYAAGTNLADGVIVYMGPASSAAPGAASSWADGGLSPSTVYYYRVFAADEVPNYSTGVWVRVTTRRDGVLYVDSAAIGAQDGRTWTDAYSSLHSALAAAKTNDTLWVAAGTYTPGTFRMATNVAVYGGFVAGMSAVGERDWVANPTILSGGGPVVQGATGARLDGFTVTGGSGVNGGGFYQSGGRVTVANCTIANNQATIGGGLYLYGVQLTMERCRIIANAATSGGGGMYAQDVMVVPAGAILNCAFIANRCEGGASGKNDGGGISLRQCPYRIENCTLFGNVTSRRGGGIKIYVGNGLEHHVIRNCILWDNQLTVPPTGDYGGCEIALQNDIAINPITLDMSYTDWSPDTTGERFYNYMEQAPTVVNFTSLMEADPTFGNAAAYDLHLKSFGGRWLNGGWTYDLTNSPCIDAGDPASSFALEPEPNGGRINMGAYGNTEQASRSAPPRPQGGFIFYVR